MDNIKGKVAFYLIFSIIIISSCKKKEINISAFEFERCLDNYSDCDSLVHDLDQLDSWQSNILLGQWFNRKKAYEQADSFYRVSLEQQKLNKELFTYYIKNKIAIESDQNQSIKAIDSVLNIFNVNNKKNATLAVRLLLLKARALNILTESKYRDACTLYAKYLEEKWSISVGFSYSPSYYNAIHLILEGKGNLALSHFEEAERKTLDRSSPDYKLFLLYKLTEAMHLSVDSIDSKDLKFISKEDYYKPSVNSSIRLQIGYSKESKTESIEDAKERIKNRDLKERDAFFNVFYLIKNLLEENEIDSAETYVTLLEEGLNISKELRFLLHFRKQEVKSKRYEMLCVGDLKSIFDLNYLTMNLAKESLSDEDNLHYADFIYNNNTNMFETLFNGVQQREKWASGEVIFSSLIQSKAVYDKIANLSYSLRGNNKLDKNKIRQYAEIIQRIESLEIKVNQYQKTLDIDISIFKDLYQLYLRKSDFEKMFNEQREKDSYKEIELNEVVNRIQKSNTQIIDITSTSQDYYFTFINPDTISIEKYLRSEVDTLLIDLANVISNNTTLEKKLANRRLFAMIQPYLKTDFTNLIIIPDQNFAKIPFEMVEIGKGSVGQPFNIGDYYNISYDYNIKNILKENIDISSKCSLFSYSDKNTLKDRSPKTITELKIGLKETEEISKLYNYNSTLNGKDLRKKKVIKNLSSPILHFSTHSSSSSDNILDNYMYVRDNKGNPEKMYGFEIKHQEIDNSLVVLSSCESGTGTYKPGAGVFSLSRDFLQAGAQTVIKSLWAVNEASTAELMVDFHKNFTEGHNASMALTLAKRKLKQNPKYAHPYYWAGFVLEGNPNVILTHKN